MTILQVNVARSGGYFVWRLINEIRKAAGYPDRSYIKNHRFYEQKGKWPDLSFEHFEIDRLSVLNEGVFCDVDVMLSEFILDMDSYVSSCAVVMSDSQLNGRHDEILSKFGHIIYLVRDPRDIVVSWSEFAFKPYFKRYGWTRAASPREFRELHLIDIATEWASHVEGYLSIAERQNIYFLKYEDILLDFRTTIEGLLDYLDITLIKDEIDNIQSRVSFSEMKKTHPEHLQHGESRRFRSILTENEQTKVRNLAGNQMRKFGYL